MKRLAVALALLLTVVSTVGSASALELTDRTVDLVGKIDTKLIRQAVQKVLELDGKSHDPIFLRIDSFGGSVEAGFVLIDTMAAIESPVYALVESKAYSMAAIITIFCEKRYILPHATMMFHEASYGTLGEDPTIRSRISFNSRFLDRMHREIAKRIKMKESEYRAKMRDGWWLLAEEALEAGVVDEVVRELKYAKVVVEKTEITRTIKTVEKRERDAPAAAKP